MPSLYEQINPSSGGATPPPAGSAGYQQGIVQRAQTLLRPQYDQAVRTARQGLANRGMFRGGLTQDAEQGIAGDFNNKIAGVASDAATHGADLGEQERVRQEQRGWSVEDMNKSMQQRKDELEQQRQIADNDRWANLIGSATGAVGNVGGMLLAKKLFPVSNPYAPTTPPTTPPTT